MVGRKNLTPFYGQSALLFLVIQSCHISTKLFTFKKGIFGHTETGEHLYAHYKDDLQASHDLHCLPPSGHSNKQYVHGNLT